MELTLDAMNEKNKILRNKLLEELNNEEIDSSRLLSLSHQFADLDTDTVRFSVDTGIINRLGKELVSKKETAVSELVKNAYDADATEVNLFFINSEQVGGQLHIIDNGIGMTRDQLVNGFMRLASTDKIHNEISPKFRRKRAGRKGIGRFSTQRLGNKLTILTKTENSLKTLKLTIDWANYEIDQNIFLVENQIEYEDSWDYDSNSGTALIIENLYESWSDAMIKRVYRFTLELIQPYPLLEPSSTDLKNVSNLILERRDIGFKTNYYRIIDDYEPIPIVDDETEILDHSLATITGGVNKEGKAYWTFKSEKLNHDEEIHVVNGLENFNESSFEKLKGMKFKADYFLYEPTLFPRGQLNFIRELAHKKGGIRLYRNNFRVLPYGEENDDWLSLDKSTTRQNILPSHRNFNFFGFVQIEDTNGVFEETASREGIIESSDFNSLKNFLYYCIVEAVKKIANLRGRKATASQKNFVSEKNRNKTNPLEDIKNIINSELKDTLNLNIDKQSDLLNNHETEVEIQLKSSLEKINDVIIDNENYFQYLIDENNLLRILGGLGLVIGEFVHEIKRFAPSFDNEIEALQRQLKNDPKALEKLELLNKHLQSFKLYTSFFDYAVSRNAIRDLESIDLRDVVRNFDSAVASDAIKSNILLETIFDGYFLKTIPMHPSEWATILFNLYSNSKKAIRRAKNQQGKILITCGKNHEKVFVEFSDNGDGIRQKDEEKIFEAFYTTSSPIIGYTDSDLKELTGTGLGLKIVQDIITSYEGEIFVDTPSEGFNTTIRIEIPKAEGKNYE